MSQTKKWTVKDVITTVLLSVWCYLRSYFMEKRVEI